MQQSPTQKLSQLASEKIADIRPAIIIPIEVSVFQSKTSKYLAEIVLIGKMKVSVSLDLINQTVKTHT
jgi:hypothetical protein